MSSAIIMKSIASDSSHFVMKKHQTHDIKQPRTPFKAIKEKHLSNKILLWDVNNNITNALLDLFLFLCAQWDLLKETSHMKINKHCSGFLRND